MFWLGGNRTWMKPDLSGMVIDLPTLRAQYFAIPKVACSSIMSLLADVLVADFPDDEWKPELFQTHKWDHLYRRQEIVLSKRAALSMTAPRWRFAFVRNPWDRLVSCYSEKIRDDGDSENFTDGVSNVLLPFGLFKRGMTFESFATVAMSIPDQRAEPHWRSQYTFLVDRRGHLPLDFLGRFERLQSDIAAVSKAVGIPAELPHLLASDRRGYREYYSGKLRELVADRYSQDVATFGYTF